MLINSEKLRLLLRLLFIILFFTEISLIIASKRYYAFSLSRFNEIKQSEFKEELAFTNFGYTQDYENESLNIIKKDIHLTSKFRYTIEEAIHLRNLFLSLASKNGPTSKSIKDPIKLYAKFKNNENLLCGELAKLHGFLLHSLEFKVRIITISRSIFDAFDRHTTVEIWDKSRNKWIITDGTFNISFMKDSTYLSSDELYDLIHSGNFNSIKVMHGVKTKYEVTIELYYISCYSLFNNLYFIPYINHIELLDLPPLRWFDDRMSVYIVQSEKFPIRGRGIYIQNAIVFFAILLNPLLILVL